MSPAADTCSHVRAIAVLFVNAPPCVDRVQGPSQAPRSLCVGDATWPCLIPATAPTCLCHTGVSPDASPGPGRRLYSTCPAQPPLCPPLPSLALLPPGDVATAAVAPGKGEVVLKQKVSHISSEGLAALAALSAALLHSPLPLQSHCSRDQGLLLPARVPFPTARPVWASACPAQVTPGSAIPVDAGAGERSCRAAPALTGPGVCYSWPCPVLKISPALRRGAVSPVWLCSVPVGWEAGRVVHFPSSTAVPQPGIPGHDPWFLLQDPPHSRASAGWAVPLGHGQSAGAGTQGWLRPWGWVRAGASQPRSGGRAGTPALHRRASLGAPSLLHAALVAMRPPAPDA